MRDGSRLDFLKQAGKTGLMGLKALITGVDIVVDPNDPNERNETNENSTPPPPRRDEAEKAQAANPGEQPTAPATAEGTAETSTPAGPSSIGSAIGRRALAHGAHRIGAATRAETGEAVSRETLEASIPLTLAVYPSAGAPLLRQALGLTGQELPPDGELEVEATSCDLAWLPLEVGRWYYERLAHGRLLAVGGYHRTALVRFGEAGRGTPIWCALGDDRLAGALPPEWRGSLYLEEPAKLIRAMESGRVGLALLGGELLKQALALPGTAVAFELPAAGGPDWVPAWGLFTAGRLPSPAPTTIADESCLLQPAEQEAGVVRGEARS